MRGGRKTTERAQSLRRATTDAERVLWQGLRYQQLGWRFRRQFPIPPYIVDFACLEAQLIIECDGGQHAEPGEHDNRDTILRRKGWRVLRFWNNDILQNRPGVLHRILEELGRAQPKPSPRKRGREARAAGGWGLNLAGIGMQSVTSLTGVAGEHYVLFELLRRGYIAALAPVGVPNTDIVVTNRDGSRLCSIQVKTRRGVGHDKGWHMQEKHESELGDRHFYCFVDLEVGAGMAPDLYVVPNADVAKVLKATHEHWLHNPGKKGQPHRPTRLRRLMPDFAVRDGASSQYKAGWMSQYLRAWKLLGLDKTDPDQPIAKE